MGDQLVELSRCDMMHDLAAHQRNKHTPVRAIIGSVQTRSVSRGCLS